MSIAEYFRGIVDRVAAHQAREDRKADEAAQVDDAVAQLNARYLTTMSFREPDEFNPG